MPGFIARLLERRRMEKEGQLGTHKRRTDSIWGEAADRSPVLTIALVVVLLLAAGSLYTPYPAELVKAMSEDTKAPRKKKKRKMAQPVATPAAPSAPDGPPGC